MAMVLDLDYIINSTQNNAIPKETILIVDAMNLFYRNYMYHKWIDSSGFHCGGSLGSLVSFKKMVKLVAPSKVYVCYEGFNSSRDRKKINPLYKEGRGKRLSPFKEGEYDMEDPDVARKRQIQEFKELINVLPVIELELDFLEADDVISILCNDVFKDTMKYILSTDKDYIQLINDKTLALDPFTNTFRDVKWAIENVFSHPNNFVLCKALKGDNSDNIAGLKGIAEKTIVKMFPFLLQEKKYTLQNIFDHAQIQSTMNKLVDKYRLVLSEQKLLKTNYELMNLNKEYTPIQVLNLKDKIQYQTKRLEYKPELLFEKFTKYNSENNIKYFNDWNNTFMRLSI